MAIYSDYTWNTCPNITGVSRLNLLFFSFSVFFCLSFPYFLLNLVFAPVGTDLSWLEALVPLSGVPFMFTDHVLLQDVNFVGIDDRLLRFLTKKKMKCPLLEIYVTVPLAWYSLSVCLVTVTVSSISNIPSSTLSISCTSLCQGVCPR